MEHVDIPFSWFIQRRECSGLRNPLLYDKYYSRKVVDENVDSLALPDLKPQPSRV